MQSLANRKGQVENMSPNKEEHQLTTIPTRGLLILNLNLILQVGELCPV